MKTIHGILLLNFCSCMAMEQQNDFHKEEKHNLKRTFSQLTADDEKAPSDDETAKPLKKPCPELNPFDQAKAKIADSKNILKEALSLYEMEARTGDPKANFVLGKIYDKGTLVERDVDKASLFFETAAKTGHAGALFKLGQIEERALNYMLNPPIENRRAEYIAKFKPFVKAVHLYQQAAAQNHRGALCALGYMYLLGRGVKADIHRAEKYLDQAAALGQMQAARKLADLYNKGDQLPKNHENESKLYQYLASRGDKYAMSKLGDHYYYGGYGVPQDFNMAAEYYYQAYLHGEEGGSGEQIGEMYEIGKGVPQDLAKAVQILREYSSSKYHPGDGWIS